MDGHFAEIASILARVRSRWRRVLALRAWRVSATGATLFVAFVYLVASIRGSAPAFFGVWLAAALVVIAAGVWVAVKLRRAPTDRQVARYIEERCPELDDALATAISATAGAHAPEIVAAIVGEAASRARQLDPDRVVSRAQMGDAIRRAAAATVALVIVCGVSLAPAVQSARLFALYVFPERVGLSVAPGDVRLREGEPLEIVAQVPAGIDGLVPVLRIADGETSRDVRMTRSDRGFTHRLDRVDQGFTYRVTAASASTPDYTVTVLRPPHVARIDLRYVYPSAFGMETREEQDGGDIYGPAGTRVHVSIATDKPVTSGVLTLTGLPGVPLRANGSSLEGELTIRDDGSYRVALADADGLRNPGETEYFIRTLEDRPPDVRIVRPASDRQVTPIEEVSIEARADDDFGIAAFELVYAIRGGAEQAIPLTRSGGGMTVNGRTTIYLEDLEVQPGDFVTYYARARDVSRGKRSSEARSDIFFLQVSPFDEEFVSAQSEGMSGSGDPAVDDLVESQKQIITATWKLDRRGRDAGASSADDIRTVGGAQAEVRKRALAQAAQMQRTADLRRRRPGIRAPEGLPPAEESESALALAATAMAGAQERLEALDTSAALPFEMKALNELMRAQADVRRREVQRQQNNGGGGRAANRQQQDLSSLFDRELARQQQTNYETPRATSESRPGGQTDALDKIKELARRQEALNREQQSLAASSKSEEERKRALERLTREQSELRQQAEDLAQQLQRGQTQAGGRQGGRSGQAAAAEQERRNQQTSRAMQGVSEEMHAAASDLRRQDPNQASQRGNRALEHLRQLERQIRGGQAGERGGAAGLQLESQQIADAERRLGKEAGRQAGTPGSPDAQRRASEQSKLAERMERLEGELARQGQAGRAQGEGGRGQGARGSNAAAAKLSDRMREAARAQGAEAARQSAEIASELDRLAERLGNEAGESDDARKLGEELARLRDLRNRLADVERQLAAQQPNARWDDARQLIDELRREGSLGVTPDDARRFNPGQSAPGTEAWKQDFSRWDDLKVQIAAALEQAESTAAARLRQQQAQERLNAGASQTVPERYRRLVDKYYRALAAGRADR